MNHAFYVQYTFSASLNVFETAERMGANASEFLRYVYFPNFFL
jgi:hypothetical protein